MSYATDLIKDLLGWGYRVEFKKVDADTYRVEVAYPPAFTHLMIAEDDNCLYALEAAFSRVGALEAGRSPTNE